MSRKAVKRRVPDASQIMAGAGCSAMDDGREAGSDCRWCVWRLPRVGMYVCLEFYLAAARLEKHMPELIRVGQRWRRSLKPI